MTKKIQLVGIPLYQILPTVTKFLQCSSKKKAVYLQRSGSPTIAKTQTEWKGEMREMSLLAHDRINCNLIIASMFSPQVTKIVLRSTLVECIPLFCKSCTKLPSSRYFCNPCEFYLKGNFYLSNVRTHSELVEDISLIHSKYFGNSSLNHCQPLSRITENILLNYFFTYQAKKIKLLIQLQHPSEVLVWEWHWYKITPIRAQL